MRLILIFLTILISLSSSKIDKTDVPSKVQNDIVFGNPYYTLGNNFLKKGNAPHAIVFFGKAFDQLKKSGDRSGMIYCLYRMASVESLQMNYKEALKDISLADSLAKAGSYQHPLWADILYLKGNLYFKKNDFDHSEQLFNECIHRLKTQKAADSTIARTFTRAATIAYYKGDYTASINYFTLSGKFGESAFGKYSLFVSDQKNNQGVINLMMAHYDEALENFRHSENIMKIGKISSPAALAGTYTNIGLIFKLRNDFTNALHFFNRSLELYLSDPENGNSQIANAYLNIAMVYQRLGNLDKQLEYLKKSHFYSEKYLPVLLPKIYWQKAAYYSDLSDFSTSENYYQKSIKKNKELFGEGPALATILNNYAEFNMYYTKDYKKSLLYFNKALPFYKKSYGNHHPSVANCLRNIGEVYFLKKEYQTALNYFHQAMIALSETFSAADVFSNPIMGQTLGDDKLIEILKAKAKTFQALGEIQKNRQDQLKYWDATFKCYVMALKIIDKLRIGYENDESRILLSENEQDTYEGAIHAGLILYQLTHQNKYLDEAFSIADQSHASSLQSAIREKEWISNLSKSDSVMFKEYHIKQDIAMYSGFIIKEKSSSKPDSSKLMLWNRRVSELTLVHEQLKSKIQVRNPLYYQFQYQARTGDLKTKVHNLINKNEVLIEYFYSKNSLVVFCLSKDTFTYQFQELPKDFESDIQKVHSFIREPKVFRTDSSACMDYRAGAWTLYKHLIKPFEKIIRGKNLLIIPDNQLMYIPFEALLTHDTGNKPYSYKELPYLIHLNSVRYLYSASLLNSRKNKRNGDKIAAYIPDYKYYKQSAENHPDNFNTRGKYYYLEQTAKEAQAIVSYFPCKVFSSIDASEENFKKYAPGFGTILLAMHAVVNDENPLLTKLVFTSNSSKEEDDQLFIYETYNLNLNSDLLILSACNTGVGKLRKGEGMMSLTRGFSLAGVQSIVMTLWSVNDNSSAELMKLFYKRLSGFLKKDDALGEAKKDYLKNTDIMHAHPYYWAGYVLIGNNEPLPVGKSKIWMLIALLPLGIGIWASVRNFRTKNSE